MSAKTHGGRKPADGNELGTALSHSDPEERKRALLKAAALPQSRLRELPALAGVLGEIAKGPDPTWARMARLFLLRLPERQNENATEFRNRIEAELDDLVTLLGHDETAGLEYLLISTTRRISEVSVALRFPPGCGANKKTRNQVLKPEEACRITQAKLAGLPLAAIALWRRNANDLSPLALTELVEESIFFYASALESIGTWQVDPADVHFLVRELAAEEKRPRSMGRALLRLCQVLAAAPAVNLLGEETTHRAVADFAVRLATGTMRGPAPGTCDCPVPEMEDLETAAKLIGLLGRKSVLLRSDTAVDVQARLEELLLSHVVRELRRLIQGKICPHEPLISAPLVRELVPLLTHHAVRSADFVGAGHEALRSLCPMGLRPIHYRRRCARHGELVQPESSLQQALDDSASVLLRDLWSHDTLGLQKQESAVRRRMAATVSAEEGAAGTELLPPAKRARVREAPESEAGAASPDLEKESEAMEVIVDVEVEESEDEAPPSPQPIEAPQPIKEDPKEDLTQNPKEEEINPLAQMAPGLASFLEGVARQAGGQ